jgi:hypothetical protein
VSGRPHVVISIAAGSYGAGAGVTLAQVPLELPPQMLTIERKIDWHEASDEELVNELKRRLDALPF